jgi:hypothetical protein
MGGDCLPCWVMRGILAMLSAVWEELLATPLVDDAGARSFDCVAARCARGNFAQDDKR